jgi:hypothetical protein
VTCHRSSRSFQWSAVCEYELTCNSVEYKSCYYKILLKCYGIKELGISFIFSFISFYLDFIRLQNVFQYV